MRDYSSVLRGELFRGGLGSLVIKLGYVGVQFSTAILLARLLGPDGYGAYAFAYSAAMLLLIPAQFGAPSYFVRIFAIRKAESRCGSFGGFVGGYLAVIALVSVTVMVLAWAAGSKFLPAGLDFSLFAASMAVVPGAALLTSASGAVRGLGHVVLSQVLEQVVRPILFFLVLLVLVAKYEVTAFAAMLSNALIALGAFLVALPVCGRVWPASQQNQARHRWGSWLLESSPFLFLAGVQVLNYQTDIVMLGFMRSESEVGQYRVAVQIADVLVVLQMAIATAIAPHLARLHQQGEWRILRRLMVRAHRVAFALTALVAGLVLPFRELFVRVAFGGDYADACLPLTVLVLGKVAYATVAFGGLAFSMFGQAWKGALVGFVMAALNVVLNVALIPLLGSLGAALASACSFVVVGVFGMVWLFRQWGVNLSAVSRLPESE